MHTGPQKTYLVVRCTLKPTSRTLFFVLVFGTNVPLAPAQILSSASIILNLCHKKWTEDMIQPNIKTHFFSTPINSEATMALSRRAPYGRLGSCCLSPPVWSFFRRLRGAISSQCRIHASLRFFSGSKKCRPSTDPILRPPGIPVTRKRQTRVLLFTVFF